MTLEAPVYRQHCSDRCVCGALETNFLTLGLDDFETIGHRVLNHRSKGGITWRVALGVGINVAAVRTLTDYVMLGSGQPDKSSVNDICEIDHAAYVRGVIHRTAADEPPSQCRRSTKPLPG